MIKTSSSSSSLPSEDEEFTPHAENLKLSRIAIAFEGSRRGETLRNAFHSLSTRSEKDMSCDRENIFLSLASPRLTMFFIIRFPDDISEKIKNISSLGLTLAKLERREFINF
jgi:hypothetical protein